MATRGRTTFLKRQREMARKDKQQRKAERRQQRKLDRASADRGPSQDEAFPADVEEGQGQPVSRNASYCN
jgi:hypothetical protein